MTARRAILVAACLGYGIMALAIVLLVIKCASGAPEPPPVVR